MVRLSDIGQNSKWIRNRCYAVAFNLSRDHNVADEVAQEAYIRIYQRIGTYDKNRSFRKWVNGVATHTAFDSFRKIKRENAKICQSGVLGGALDDDEFLNMLEKPKSLDSCEELMAKEGKRERERVVREAISELPQKSRSILLMHYYNNMSYEDIAGALNLVIGTVKSRGYIARGKLRRLLEDKLDGLINN